MFKLNKTLILLSFLSLTNSASAALTITLTNSTGISLQLCHYEPKAIGDFIAIGSDDIAKVVGFAAGAAVGALDMESLAKTTDKAVTKGVSEGFKAWEKRFGGVTWGKWVVNPVCNSELKDPGSSDYGPCLTAPGENTSSYDLGADAGLFLSPSPTCKIAKDEYYIWVKSYSAGDQVTAAWAYTDGDAWHDTIYADTGLGSVDCSHGNLSDGDIWDGGDDYLTRECTVDSDFSSDGILSIYNNGTLPAGSTIAGSKIQLSCQDSTWDCTINIVPSTTTP